MFARVHVLREALVKNAKDAIKVNTNSCDFALCIIGSSKLHDEVQSVIKAPISQPSSSLCFFRLFAIYLILLCDVLFQQEFSACDRGLTHLHKQQKFNNKCVGGTFGGHSVGHSKAGGVLSKCTVDFT